MLIVLYISRNHIRVKESPLDISERAENHSKYLQVFAVTIIGSDTCVKKTQVKMKVLIQLLYSSIEVPHSRSLMDVSSSCFCAKLIETSNSQVVVGIVSRSRLFCLAASLCLLAHFHHVSCQI